MTNEKSTSPEQKRRAESLRRQIDELKDGGAEARQEGCPESTPASPREFVHKRMRELDKRR
jgi:hypothetical protein